MFLILQGDRPTQPVSHALTDNAVDAALALSRTTSSVVSVYWLAEQQQTNPRHILSCQHGRAIIIARL